MAPRVTSVSTPVAHLVGPGKLNVINGRLAFSTGKAAPLRLDPATLRTLFCYGPVGVSDEAMRALFQHDVEVAWLSAAGQRCRGRLVRSDPSTTALRLQQYQVLTDPKLKLLFARHVVLEKICSQIAAGRHYQRHGHPHAKGLLRKLRRLRKQAAWASDVEALRGIEGAASHAWFRFFGKLLCPPSSAPSITGAQLLFAVGSRTLRWHDAHR
ncbi:MAG TPA: hypothetical protein EYP56_02555 [Planctomycetaceae bacterium]|nr:hypothetical protein [Planctomycetaceae bacterium]HIQ22811.1 hypothetical protein [Planctomycetota bacterium]